MLTILNYARLQRKLKRLPDAARAEIRLAMEAAAAEIVSMMKSLVPVDKGALRDSIGWTWGTAPARSMKIAAVRGGDLRITIYAGSSAAFYARWQEFGTQKMPASPYFYVSYRANRKSAKRRIRAASRSAARKVAAGG